MKTIDEIKIDLDFVRRVYSNLDLFKDDYKALKICKYYDDLMFCAPPLLLVFYKYRFQKNYTFQQTASYMDYSLRYVRQLTINLYKYLSELSTLHTF